MNTRWIVTMLVICLAVLAIGLYGCPERYEEPVGEIGEQLQEDLEEAGEAIEEAVEDVRRDDDDSADREMNNEAN